MSRRRSARAIASRFSRDPVSSARLLSTGHEHRIAHEPVRFGIAPVTNDDALTRVTVGNTE